MAVVPGLPAALSRAKQLGCWIVGLDDAADRSLFELDELGREPVVLVLGAEGAGLSRLVRSRCDLVVEHPDARPPVVAQRGRRRRAGLLRGRPPTHGPAGTVSGQRRVSSSGRAAVL